MKAEIKHASMMSPPSGVVEDPESEDYRSLGTMTVPSTMMEGHDLGESVGMTVQGVYTAKQGKECVLHIASLTPSGSKNQADAEEQKLRGTKQEGN